MKPKLIDKILDVRPIFARGGVPCSEIERAVAALKPHQRLVLLAPFEPIPLYTKLGNQGLGHRAEELEDGSWRIEFHPDLPVEYPPATGHHACNP